MTASPARNQGLRRYAPRAAALAVALASSAPAFAPLPAIAQAAPAAGGRSYDFSLKKLGADTPLMLRGTEGSITLPFDVRADEVASAARAHLYYSYSPALLPDLSHINVLVNGEVAATLPVPKENAGKPQEAVVDLPPQLITQFNTIRLQLIGHYTMQCEDPLNTTLWAEISNRSTVELTVSPVGLANDLGILPLPFFDPRDARPLSLPFVFAGAPDDTSLEAAGVLASWFGALASYRGARFPAAVGQIPDKGNAVVLAIGGFQAGGLDVPAPGGATVSIVPNPNDPYGKILVVSGRDAKELKRAAQAVASGSRVLTGQHAVVTQLPAPAPRQPYDAPRWIPSDRPVKLGELMPPAKLNVSGFSPAPILVDMHLPPDLFAWREDGVPMDLKFRYTAQQRANSSSLTMALNGELLRSFPLPAVDRLGLAGSLLAKLESGDTLPVESRVLLPLQSLPPKSQLQFRFQYDFLKEGECRDVIVDNARGAISPDSTIDISGLHHYIALPDLAVFQNSGFPFTRLADLSQTAVIMPDNPGPAEYGAFLGLMGRLSESTGYPGLGVTVAQAAQAKDLADKDLLVIASGDNQPLLRQWADRMPASLGADGNRFNLSDWVYRAWNWIVPNPRVTTGLARGSVSVTTDGASVVFAGFESPLKSGRSVVAVAASRPEGLADAVTALIGDDVNGYLQGSLAVVRGKTIDAVAAGPVYYVGSLGLFRGVQWFATRNPWILVVLTLIGIGAVGLAAYLALRRRASQRLQG